MVGKLHASRVEPRVKQGAVHNAGARDIFADGTAKVGSAKMGLGMITICFSSFCSRLYLFCFRR